MTRLIHHIRGNVVAYLALFVALGGTSYAAVSVPRNSVGAPQIQEPFDHGGEVQSEVRCGERARVGADHRRSVR